MKKSSIISSIAVILMFAYGTAYPAIVVETVKGEVAVREGRQWKPLKEGQSLAEGSKISTGVRSTAVIKIDGSTLTVRPLTMMKIYRNRKIQNTDNTHIGLKYGSLKARVKRIGKLKTSFKISTPVATSSVRGTTQIVTHGAKKGTTVEVPRGSAECVNTNGGSRVVSGNQKFQQNPDNPKPDNLLADTHNSSLQPLYDPNNIDEKPLQDFVNDDTVGSGGTDTFDVISNTTPGGSVLPPQPTTTTVNIDVQWP